ncbi:DNA polymerase IV [Burkholderiaceae bacterium DAT-1]|nr:DNA polymerase IV [Burkholderiaceae bacterium DAT-1]
MRKIIHIDCDCFYASVEMRDNPSLRGRPVAVGGRPEQRGVISTSNYEARKFGVRSAMASSEALRRCPDLVLLKPDFTRYREASRAVHRIFREFTDLIEPLSLDEAYLDVTGVEHCQGSATRMAQAIRARIEAEVGITASAGIAPNKFVAKVASDWNKPNGQFLVVPEDVDGFVAALPVAKLWGVGKVTAGKLNQLGIQTCGDLRQWALPRLAHEFGKMGERMWEMCRGIDHRPVSNDQPRRSLSVENTYVDDLRTLDACTQALDELLADLRIRYDKLDDAPPLAKVFIKLRFSDFSRTTAECTATTLTREDCVRLLSEAHQRSHLPVRLLGVGIRFSEQHAAMQLSLF